MKPAPAPSGSDLSRRESLRRIGSMWALAAAAPLIASCGGGGGDSGTPSAPQPPAPTPGTPVPPAPPSGGTGPAKWVTLNRSLASPWGMDFLPDGRFIITQKGGTMVIVSADGSTVTPVGTIGNVFTGGQGGLLDVAVDPDFAAGENWIYYTFSENIVGVGNGTAVGRARLSLASNTLSGHVVIFQQSDKSGADAHYGSRLVFRGDKTLFVTLGERKAGAPAQDLTKTLGKVVRINRNGSIPSGNPSFGTSSAPGIWTYGHRNPQGAALHPDTGELWVAEHGPLGGDEINIAQPGLNFGWPLVSYGCEYGTPNPDLGCAIGGTRGVHAPYTEPVVWWPAPSTAPSNMIFYTGNKFPEWNRNILVGSLVDLTLWRIVLNGNAEASRQKVFPSMSDRIRDVAQGPDGWIYLLTDGGQLIRVER